MKRINNKIVYSYDIKRILAGYNSYDFKYDFKVGDDVINRVRTDFEKNVNLMFKNDVSIISEEKMMGINDLVGGDYPHCYA